MHKDEHFFVEPAIRMVAQGSLNPQWFGHPGSTTIYPTAAALKVRTLGTNSLTVSQMREWAYPMGRYLSLLYFVACVPLGFLAARRAFGTPVGLVAAGLVAGSPWLAAFAQITRTDTAATFFMLLALWLTLRAADRGSLAQVALAGLASGVAVSLRYFMLALLPGLPLAAWLGRGSGRWSFPGRVVVMVAALVVGFVATTPYFFADWQHTLDSLKYQANRTGDERAAPLSHPEIFVWYFTQAVPVVMGLVETILAYGGLAFALRRKPVVGLILGAFVLAFFAGISLDDIYYYRRGIQAYTVLSLTAAYAVVQLAQLAMDLAASRRRGLPLVPTPISSLGVFLV